MPGTTLLWFRITEALPLAEHAMACPAHHLTGAQIHANAVLRPALIWTSTDTEDLLTSNGLPSWHDKDGERHAAAAHTWTHTPTGRRGVPIAPEQGQRYLRIFHRHHDPHRIPLITRLRRAAQADTGGHWLIHDTAAFTTETAWQVLDHRHDIAPTSATWTPATVTATAVDGHTYPALIADGYTVHGHDVIARFDRPTVEQMIHDLNAVHTNASRYSDPMPGEYPVLRLDGDTLIVSEQHDDGRRVRLIEVDRSRPDLDGFYAAGAYLWPWYSDLPAEDAVPDRPGAEAYTD